MRRAGFLFLLTMGALAAMGSPGEARGFRGGGFRGGGMYMGSVRHSYYYTPHPYSNSYRADAARRYPDYTQAAYHRAVYSPAGTAARVGAATVAWGAHVATLPAGYRRRWWRNRYWYYNTGWWYVDGDNDYVATQPPIGMIVNTLPAGAVESTINGLVYYSFNGVWYKPIMAGGGASYEVVAKPAGG